MHEARGVDVNGDGRLDIVSGQENYDRYDPPRNGELDWWENTTNGGGSVTAAPANTAPPTVAGSAQQGQTLSGSDGS